MLDAEGFTETDRVWEQVQKRFPGRFSYDDLVKVVAGDQDGKKRYEIRGRQIRAMYGHSDVRPIEYAPAEPPETLYHGTTTKALPSIRNDGLRAQSRQYVHMTINRMLAEKVADRHSGDNVILTIRSGEAHRAGIVFYHPEDQHYLADAILPEFIDFPPAE